MIKWLKQLFCQHGKPYYGMYIDRDKPSRAIGVGADMLLHPVIVFEMTGHCRLCGKYIKRRVQNFRSDRISAPEFYKKRDDFPCDPVTGKELPVL